MYKSTELFLSTPSARRATSRFLRTWQRACISIHALREEGDTEARPNHRPASNFYPRPPRGGRPVKAVENVLELIISIHALREEGDNRCVVAKDDTVKFLSTPSARRATWSAERSRHRLWNFYPRPPRGGRHRAPACRHLCQLFLSTPSARRATSGRRRWLSMPYNFYPRPPRGGRLLLRS